MGTWPSYTDAEDERGLSVSFSAREKAKIIAEGLFLRPADRGSHAWLFLLASFFIEGLALGKSPLCYYITEKVSCANRY